MGNRPQETAQDQPTPPELRFWVALKPRPKGNRDEIRTRRQGRKTRRWIAPPDWVTDHQAALALLASPSAPRVPWPGPVELDVAFTFAPPPSWPKWKQAAALEGRIWPASANVGDRDNLEKMLGDALKGLMFRDDCQVVGGQVSKVYGPEDGYRVAIRFLKQARKGDQDAELAQPADRAGRPRQP